MGLIRQGMVERTSGTTTLSLAIPAGQSALVRDIYYYEDAATAEDLKVSVDRKRVLNLKAPSGWFFTADRLVGGYVSIRDVLKVLKLWPEIPVAEGETFEVSGPTANSYMEAVYDLYEAGDILNTRDNGSHADRYRLAQLISNSSTRTTAGDLELDQSDIETIFPAFPGGKTVPEGMQMELLAIFGAAATKGTGAANGEYTTYLKMLKDREDLLDKDLGGFTFRGDSTYTTAAVKYETVAGRVSAGVQYMPPRVMPFDPPIIFRGGDELNVFATIGRTGAGADFAAGDIKLGMLFDVSRM